MAGYSKVFFIGSTGGFMGSDGLARPFVQFLQGDSDRQWLEPVYQDESERPLGSVEAIVPARPDDPLALLDAAIAFLPQLFAECPSMAKVEPQLKGVTRLDFDFGDGVPDGWQQLRQEALPIFRKLNVFEADLRRVDVSSLPVDGQA